MDRRWAGSVIAAYLWAAFIPLYLGASAWAWAAGRDPYRDNVFEREAMTQS